jgi:Na+-driven multidrug efflux pump
LAASVLLGHGRVRWRLAGELAALATMAALMLAWVPARSATGAAWAVVVAEWGLALVLWAGVLAGRSARREETA